MLDFSTTRSATDQTLPPFSASAGRAGFALYRRGFDRDLWTSRTTDSRVRFSDGPVFSGAVYFADLVQSPKSSI